MLPETERWLEVVTDVLGLDLIEFNSDILDPLFNAPQEYIEVAKEIRIATQEAGVRIHNYFTGEITHYVNFLTHPDPRLRGGGIRWAKGAIDIASIIGARAIGSNFNNIPFYVRENEKSFEATLDYLISALASLTEYSREKGLDMLLWEQMYAPSEVPYTINQAKDLFAMVNEISSLPVRMVIDFGHACARDFEHTDDDLNPYRWIEECGSLAEVIHLQQTDGVGSRHWPFTPEYNRRGIIDPEKFLDVIEKSGASELYLIFEIFFSLNTPESKIFREMEDSVKFWRKYI
ncbi:MAG: sugar phosphate isomerase/epimerase [Actinobacteria bacterium]|nr:sugar phosphate isomerase/epimerase [Actinomycetota bacterium]